MKVLELNNVGKKFPLFEEANNLREGGNDVFQNKESCRAFWAVRNINMQINKGEIIGIIGRNGAGKTTLLQIIAGVLSPNEGEVKIKGKVSSLFTLGTGFQNELSGRENIYLNGSISGMSNDQINKNYQNIVDFSELNDFINMPLGSFSDGMRMRLGFSVASHTDFDILLIDEALLVGDISFQKKCFDVLLDYKQKGKTLILVTQSLGVIEQLCDRAYLLEEGRVVFNGSPQETTDRYRKLLNEKGFLERKNKNIVEKTKRWAEDIKLWGQKETTSLAAIKSVDIFNKWGQKTNKFKSKDKLRVKINFESYRQLNDIHFGVALFREDGVYCYGPNTRWDGYKIDLSPGQGWVILGYNELLLAAGIYYLSIVIWEKNEEFSYDCHRGCYRIEIKGKNCDRQLLNLPFKWKPFFWQLPLYNSIEIKELGDKEEDIKNKEGAKIGKVELLDKKRRTKNKFITGEELNIKVNFTLNKEKLSNQNLSLWIGIFRSDGVYCHGVSRKVGYKDKEMILTYPQLRLLPGEYRVSVGLWDDKKGGFIAYHHKIYPFKVMFTKPDHGTVYLSHKWKVKFLRPTGSKKIPSEQLLKKLSRG